MEALFEDCTLFDRKGGFCRDHLVIILKGPNAVESFAPTVNLRPCDPGTKAGINKGRYINIYFQF
jgi:hypothetical protein